MQVGRHVRRPSVSAVRHVRGSVPDQPAQPSSWQGLTMPDPRHRRPNNVVIDPESVTRRVASLRRRVGRRVRIFAALKADGYGFGTLPMEPAALAGGDDALDAV